jgi:predicted dehydrogenase
MAKDWQYLKVLVVGCGSIGKRHSRVLREIGVKTLFACDPVAEQVQAAAKETHFDQIATSFDAGLALRPDVVFLCTPPALHIPQALQAMAAGCDVFSEKPLSVDLSQADELAQAIAHTGRKFMVGLCFRYHRGLLKAKQMLDSDAIGRLVSVRAMMGEHLPAIRPDYRDLYLAKCNGAFELMHDIDLAIWYAGQKVKTVRSINGNFSDIGIEAPDLVEILMEFEQSCVANVHLDFFTLPRTRRIELYGTRGAITIEFASWNECTLSVYDSASSAWATEKMTTDRDDMFRDEDRDFLVAVAEDRPIICTLDEGAKSLGVVLQAQGLI